MRLTTLTSKLFSLFVLLAATASMSCAISLPVRGASNYGNGPDFAGCASVPPIAMCGEGFNLTPVGTFSLGGKTYSIVQFAFDPGFDPTPTGVNILNVVDLGMIGPNTTFTLPPAFFTPAFTEILSCNSVTSPVTPSSQFPGIVALDSSGTVTIPGPCVPGLTSAPDITLNADGSFTTGANFNLADLVLDSPVPTNTPEPATLLLLGAGLLAVGGRKLRRAN